MNRVQGRITKYRKKLTNYIKEYNISFNLDIHSFWQEDAGELYVIDEHLYPTALQEALNGEKKSDGRLLLSLSNKLL